MAQTILLAGGTGFIGRRLADMLRAKGHSVRLLTRFPKGADQFAWNPLSGQMDDSALVGVQVVINLAGAGIADGRWTASRKKLIVESRVQGAHTLLAAMQRTGCRPEVYLSASAIGYYGNTGERWLTENDTPADNGFLARASVAWEQAAEQVRAFGVRMVVFRIGIALDLSGGALREIVRPMRFGIGTYFANGNAWYSWIHRNDLCRMFLWAAENPQIEGVFNAVAPQPVRNKVLVQATAKAMGRPVLLLPVPAFALRLVLGEMANTVLFSNRISADKIVEAGFHFQSPELGGALEDIFGPCEFL
ncbi:MAG: TIGR01777 family oxidoreductase [Saprospiraceae bacterium]